MTQSELKKLYDSGDKNIMCFPLRSRSGELLYFYGTKGTSEIYDALAEAEKDGRLIPIDA